MPVKMPLPALNPSLMTETTPGTIKNSVHQPGNKTERSHHPAARPKNRMASASSASPKTREEMFLRFIVLLPFKDKLKNG